MRKSKAREEQSTKVVLTFLGFTALLIFFGISLKFYLLFANSHFDGVHEFLVEVRQGPQMGDIIALSPDNASADILQVNGATSPHIAQSLGLPTDTTIQETTPFESLQNFAQDLLFHGVKSTSLNIIDKIRIFLFANSLKSTDITLESLTMPADPLLLQKTLPQLFIDHTMYTENKSVSVINATGESGIGTAIAKLLGNLGVNVISVTTAQNVQDNSTLVYSGNESYTAKRISQLLNADRQASQKAMLSDIVVTIGKKSLEKLGL